MRAYHEDRSRWTKAPVTLFKAEDMSFLAHWHAEVEIVAVLRGELRVGIDRETRSLSRGDLAVAASREIHYYETTASSETILAIFRPEIADCPGGWPADGRFETPFVDARARTALGMDPGISARMGALLVEALREQDEAGEAHALRIKSCMLELCCLLLRHLPRRRTDTGEERRRLLRLERLQAVLSYLDSHYMQAFSTRDAAEHANLSVYYFSRIFKDCIGMGFKRYLDNLRIHKAEALIQNTSLPITEIALGCGFESVRTFNRVFKAVKGCAPSSMR